MHLQLTFFSWGRIAPILLGVAIVVYLLWRKRRDKSAVVLAVYIGLLTAYNLAFFLGFSINHPLGAYAWHLACIIAFASVARLQFAYYFPGQVFGRERKIVLYGTLLLALLAVVDYFIRAGDHFRFMFGAHAYGSYYASLPVPAVTFVCFLGSIIVSLRGAALLYKKQDAPYRGMLARLKAVWGDSPDFRVSIFMGLVTLGEVLLSMLTFLGFTGRLSMVNMTVFTNFSVLLILSFYVLIYSSASLERTGLMHRLIGISLVSVLFVLTLAGAVMEKITIESLYREKENQARLLAEFRRREGTPTQLQRAGAKTFFNGYFYFINVKGRAYYGLELDDLPGSPFIWFDYKEYRTRLHQVALPFVLILLAVTAIVLFLFPLLFRASLVAPVQGLLGELGQISRKGPGKDGGEDELSALRSRFGEMIELLRQARRELPDFSSPLEAVERTIETEAETKFVRTNSRVLVYRSGAMAEVVRTIERIKKYPQPVLITGETGTGKELIARLIHEMEGESETPFVPVNSAALPEGLWESEIFGHRKGAFTDAARDRRGRIAEAQGGTVFFDEIGEMPLEVQARMLRLLQERRYTPLGSDEELEAECRFVFATNRDLNALTKAGLFREDLLYRISVFPVHIPPLRERKQDIVALTRHLVQEFARENELPEPGLAPGLLELLESYGWPGNVRELENAVIRGLASLSEGKQLGPEDFGELQVKRKQQRGAGGVTLPASRMPFDEQMRRYSRQLIQDAMLLSDGNKTRAAEILGMKRTTLRNRMKDLGL